MTLVLKLLLFLRKSLRVAACLFSDCLLYNFYLFLLINRGLLFFLKVLPIIAVALQRLLFCLIRALIDQIFSLFLAHLLLFLLQFTHFFKFLSKHLHERCIFHIMFHTIFCHFFSVLLRIFPAPVARLLRIHETDRS